MRGQAQGRPGLWLGPRLSWGLKRAGNYKRTLLGTSGSQALMKARVYAHILPVYGLCTHVAYMGANAPLRTSILILVLVAEAQWKQTPLVFHAFNICIEFFWTRNGACRSVVVY